MITHERMKVSSYSQMLDKSGKILAALVLLGANGVAAQPNSTDYAVIPPLISDSASPNVMLVMSNDHELYKKAYSDYSDLNDDGILDGTYNDVFTYSGYFDSNFCYSYSTTNQRYEPETDISSLIGTSGHSCAAVSGNWSGNFMNWVTMTRMDIVRTVLYGGLRDVDTATSGGFAGVTVLERSFIPEDAHSFVKVFAGDTEKYTPYTQAAVSLCNITMSGPSYDPLVRIAYGSWPLWSGGEGRQCHYTNEYNTGLGNQPGSLDRPTTYNFSAKVQVCKAGVDSGNNRCKAYTDSSTGDITYKPTGLLQEYGDNGNMNFGLMTGSYNKKIDGGVLRKDILPLTGNASSSDDEVDLDSGVFINQGSSDGGIINTLNRFRIVNWDYSSNIYGDCSTWNIPKSTFTNAAAASNRKCRNWGNPLSEIYLEALRYFTGDEVSGATAGNGLPTSGFNTSDSGQISSLPQLSWTDPLDSSNFCAACSIIVISTGLNSFDKDGLASVTDIWKVAGTSRLSTTDLDALVDAVGIIEAVNVGTYLVGSNGVINNELCTAKAISNLSDVEGICPEVPGLEGGFDIAGLAYHAHISDLRNDFAGQQNVNTFSIAIAESLPSFELDVNGKTVSFVPTCQAHANGGRKIDQSGFVNCSFLDVTIESQDANGGRMYIVWEDSLWGSDFDMDGVSRIEWCIGNAIGLCPGEPPNNSALGAGYTWNDFDWQTTGTSADTIQFRVSGVLTAAGNALKFGYILSGVEAGGSVNLITNTPSAAKNTAPLTNASSQYISSGTLGNGDQSFLLVRGGYGITRLLEDAGNTIIYHEPALYTASSSVTAGKLLNNPLWYTAKYGSYNDIDGDGTPKYNNDPLDTREWDSKDTLGNPGADGIPDNFFPIRNPTELITSLSQIFQSISERISSGTAAAVVANSSTGLGAVYQAYYHPNYTDSFDATITWGGVLHAMFIDESGRFREDNGTVGTLDDTSTDYVIDIFFDETVTPNRTRFQRFTQTGSGPTATLTAFGSPDDLEDLGSIWNARDVLANISQNNLLTQRTINISSGMYGETAQSKRYIFTFLDSISSGTFGVVDAGEVIDFVHSNFDPSAGDNFRYLGLSNSSEATNLVKYIRGQDISGFRSRLVDIPGDGTSTQKYWMLGDIVHSSPLVVNPPNERYDISFGDGTYDNFKQQYSRRRQMIYTGGNDGMLHAFNGGIWDAANQTFRTQTFNSATGIYDQGLSHQLGAEMWAYVPMNLLPHIQWLKENDYPHVYYMDAPPQSFDVNIFAPDATHPEGWGTILVAGMRLGGGDFPIDLDGNGSDETTMRSAFVIMDITDPEQPPTLMAEISQTDLGFTTSAPALIKARVSSSFGSFVSPSVNRWLLVFGSGPDTLNTATSQVRDAKLYAYDLVLGEMITVNSSAQAPVSDPSGFFGDILSVDWNNDYKDDAIYIGTIEGSEVAPSGRMKRIVLSQTTDMGLSSGAAAMSDMLNVGQPISAKANMQTDTAKNERWILFGTGRLFTRKDNSSVTQQSFYGVKEPANYDTSAITTSDLVNSTDIIVQTTGEISDGSLGTQVTIDGTNLDTFNDLFGFMDTEDGWVRALSYTGTTPSERVFNTSIVLGSTVVFTSYLPNVDLCTVEGDGFLYALNFRTGTAEKFGPLGDDANDVAFPSIDLGQGAPSAPTVVVRTGDDVNADGSANEGNLSVVTGSTTGVTNSTAFSTAPGAGGRMSWEILKIPF